jgi:hypothetical protein
VPKYAKDYESNWEPEVLKLPVVISFPGTELKSRDVVVGLELNGVSRAYPWDTLLKQSPVMDRVAGIPMLLAVAPDKKSFRVFVSRIDGKDAEFFLKGESEDESNAARSPTKIETPVDASGSAGVPPAVAGAASPRTPQPAQTAAKSDPPVKPWLLLDTTTASEWNFQGCAVSGPAQGKCLDRVSALKDYWFDWRNYHSDTTVYKH